jgi:hypothetical protein
MKPPIQSRTDLLTCIESCVLGDVRPLVAGVDSYYAYGFPRVLAVLHRGRILVGSVTGWVTRDTRATVRLSSPFLATI